MKGPSLFHSFRFAFNGLGIAFKNERNLRIHFCMAGVVLLFAFILKISKIEWIILLLTITLVIFAELLNTAIEAVVDLICKDEYHHYGKIAKDVAAGAVLLTSLTAVLVGAIIFLPYFIV